MPVSNLVAMLAYMLIAQAPSDAAVACASANLTDADKSAVARSMIDNADTPQLERIAAQVEACLRPTGADREAGRALMIFVVAQAAGEGMAPMLTAQGIEPVLIDRWFAAQPEEARTSLPDEAAGERIVRGLIAAGVPTEVAIANGTLIGNYIATLILREQVRVGHPPAEGREP